MGWCELRELSCSCGRHLLLLLKFVKISKLTFLNDISNFFSKIKFKLRKKSDVFKLVTLDLIAANDISTG